MSRVSGGKPHFALGNAIGRRAVAKLDHRAPHETACFERRTNRSEQFVSVWAVHVESPIAPVHRYFISIVFTRPRRGNVRLELLLKRKERIQIGRAAIGEGYDHGMLQGLYGNFGFDTKESGEDAHLASYR